jgi:hypothetical protein
MASYAASSVQFLANGTETARGRKRNFPVSVNASILATIQLRVLRFGFLQDGDVGIGVW